MAKATINTGDTAQPVHTRTTSDTAESQVAVLGIDGSDSVVPADATKGLKTDPSSAGDVATTLTDGRKTVTAAGIAEAISATLACQWVTLTALKTNTGDIYAGGSAVSAVSGSEAGQPLAAGDSITFPVDDAATVFIDAEVSGEGVTFTVGS